MQFCSSDDLRCGIVDVGSNTIRAAVYEVKDGCCRMLADQRDFSNLLTYVEQGYLSEGGIQRLCTVLTGMKEFCKTLKCHRIDCFATASLRGISNFLAVQQRVQAVGVNLILLSGEEEALCDYEGLLRGTGVATGIGMDLGGGSCQLFRFQERELMAYASFPIGVMAMKRRFSMDCAPGEEDRAAVQNFVLSQLEGCPALRGEPASELYVMGGTVRAAYQAYNFLKGSPQVDSRLEKLTVGELQDLYNHLSSSEGQLAVWRADPDRLPTIGSGLIVMLTICEFMGAPGVAVVRNGVREGYLWKNVMKAAQ